ncbi:hypothetical protein F2P81_009491 [Scophthalmus maximus]|uniref:Uncharacterized protein n=1 Tax=Scophthalmus maximus TaxID=52904 RepID=A0A6A4SZ89_SCOMX|nr:hypothetical protein F2P81_009491 [Scophthalmus maximus]
MEDVKSGKGLWKYDISYAEAIKKVQGKKARQQTEIENTSLTALVEQAKYKETAALEDNIILFVSYVINCTDQVKHKTEKIKIIAKGAERFLGIKNLTWEHINKRLEAEGKPGSQAEGT